MEIKTPQEAKAEYEWLQKRYSDQIKAEVKEEIVSKINYCPNYCRIAIVDNCSKSKRKFIDNAINEVAKDLTTKGWYIRVNNKWVRQVGWLDRFRFVEVSDTPFPPEQSWWSKLFGG